TRTANRFSSRDEESDGERVPIWRKGYQGARCRAAQRRGNRALGVVPGWPASAAHAQSGHRLRQRRFEHDVRDDRREGLDLQRRNGEGTQSQAADVEVARCPLTVLRGRAGRTTENQTDNES